MVHNVRCRVTTLECQKSSMHARPYNKSACASLLLRAQSGRCSTLHCVHAESRGTSACLLAARWPVYWDVVHASLICAGLVPLCCECGRRLAICCCSQKLAWAVLMSGEARSATTNLSNLVLVRYVQIRKKHNSGKKTRCKKSETKNRKMMDQNRNGIEKEEKVRKMLEKKKRVNGLKMGRK